MRSKKILIVVPDGTGVRNYLFSDIIPKLLEKKSDILIYHKQSEEALREVEKLHGVSLKNRQAFSYKETIIQKFFREAICNARLNYNGVLERNKTVLKYWRPKKKSLVKKLFYFLVELSGNYVSKRYQRILSFEKYYQKLIAKNLSNELAFLEELNPDVLFCTHQRATTAIPIFKAAELLGIRTVGAIYSWDNLVKARLTVRTNEYVVWSNYMKDEMRKYYPEISESKIHITGTPQFKLYEKSKYLNKVDFFNQFGLSTEKFTICFSGDDELTSPYDPQYLEELCESIKNSVYMERVQILFRRSPADISGRYDTIAEKYKELLICIEPKWSNQNENWTQLYPYPEDIDLLGNICKHSDLVINVGSTMAHDFAIFDKPTAYLNYDVVDDSIWSVDTIYKYQHFKSMPNKDAVYWINSKNDFIPIIEEVFENPKTLGKEWLEVINNNELDTEQVITNHLLN